MFVVYGWKKTDYEFESDLGCCPFCGAYSGAVIRGYRTISHISGLPLGGWNKHWTCSCKNCGKTRKLKGKEVKSAAARSASYSEYFRFARNKEPLSLAILLIVIGLILTSIGAFGNQQKVYGAKELDFNVQNTDTHVTFDSVFMLYYFATKNDDNNNVVTYYFAGIFTGDDGKQYLTSFEIGGRDDLFEEAEAYLSDSSMQIGDFAVPVYGQLDVMKDGLSSYYDEYIETLNSYQDFPEFESIKANVAYIAPTLEDSKAADQNNIIVGLVLLLPGILILVLYITKMRRIQKPQLFD